MSTEALGTEVKGPSRHLYNRDGNLIGSWRCRPSDPEFPGGWVELPTVVFPRTTVQITQQGEEPLVGDPNVVVLYRGQQEYSRGVVDPEGDRCEYFEIEPDWIRQATRRYDPAVAEYAPSPFARQTHAVVGPELYLFQRMLTRQLENDPQLDPMLVEGAVARILDFVVHAIFQCREQAPTNGSSKATRLHRSIVLDTKAFLGANLAKKLTLAEIGREVGASSYHLARVFRRSTGSSIYRYLMDLRLRTALEHLEDEGSNIGDVAIRLGFSDHSHMTKEFRERFKITPSQYRRKSRHQLSMILIA